MILAFVTHYSKKNGKSWKSRSNRWVREQAFQGVTRVRRVKRVAGVWKDVDDGGDLPEEGEENPLLVREDWMVVAVGDTEGGEAGEGDGRLPGTAWGWVS